MSNESDPAFESVLRSSGNITQFLDEFFNFLFRRTDFYLECPPEGGSFGFTEGEAEKLLLRSFNKWKNHPKPHPEIMNTKFLNQKEEKEKQIHVQEAQKNIIQPKEKAKDSPTTSSSDTYNGRSTDKYSWSQTIGELDVRVPIGPLVKKGKDVKVIINSDRISVGLSVQETIFEGKFPFPVNKSESFWNLFPGESIQISLQKLQERWWSFLIEGEDPIDMKKIEAVKPFEDLEEIEQMKIQEMMWNQERKNQGLKTSDETKLENILKDAWDKDGSPFKGQPFDPSLVRLGNSSSTQPPI